MHVFAKAAVVLAGGAALTVGATAPAVAAPPGSSGGAEHTSTTTCVPGTSSDPTFCITLDDLYNPVATPSGNTNTREKLVETFGFAGDAPIRDVQSGHELTKNGQVQQSSYLGRVTLPGVLTCTVHTVIANGVTRVDKTGCR